MMAVNKHHDVNQVELVGASDSVPRFVLSEDLIEVIHVAVLIVSVFVFERVIRIF